jgi:hypothetical protein
MADYYPLISRAVSALEKNNGENRRALYERARAALLAQLRGINPPLNESDITRERLALEESIRKVEAEAARSFSDTTRQPPAPKIRPIEPSGREASQASVPLPRAAPPTPVRTNLRPQPVQAPREASEVLSRVDLRAPTRRDTPPEPRPQGRAAEQPRQQSAPAVAPPSWPPKEPPVSNVAGPAIERLAAGEAQATTTRHPLRGRLRTREPLAGDEDKREKTGAFAREMEPPASWPIGELESGHRTDEHVGDSGLRALERPDAHEQHEQPFEAAGSAAARRDFSESMLEPSYGVDEAEAEARPHDLYSDAETDVEQDVPKRIWQLRPSPRLVKGLAAVMVGLAVLGALVWQWASIVSVYRSVRAPAVETARETPAVAAKPKIADRIEPGSQSTPLTPQAAAAVAQKVVLYEEDPADPNGRRFVGSAIWRTETVTPGPGQQPELAIRADVEVPERKLAMTWSLRRNTDKGLPASHTVEIMFRLPTDFPSGGISNVPGILMKQAEQTRGVPLAGLAVKVTNGFFLIGLSSVDSDKERNVALLKERAWLDIPVVYNNNRRAILALEKGTPGERVFAEAFKVWKQ